MIDFVTIKVKAGNGGNGAVSFFKLLNMRYGKADGGDGGNGGSVFVAVDKGIFDLERFRGRNLWPGENGENGKSGNQKGKEGSDLVLKVPQGTVLSVKMDFRGKKQSYTYDLKNPEDSVLVAKGGQGGRGNTHARFKRDHKGKRPEHWDIFNVAQKGREGELAEITLELKYLAQVGLIGLPNVGKSSLLAVLTNARPQIADYPFTTLEPNVGVLNQAREKTKIIIADIPGIIEGAAQGKGLGLTFLRHIERTKLLIHVLSADSLNLKNYRTIREELGLYNKELVEKKEIVVLNKIDLLNEKEKKAAVKKLEKLKLILVSAKTGEGVEKLKQIIMSLA